jgi:hypothetical protein
LQSRVGVVAPVFQNQPRSRPEILPPQEQGLVCEGVENDASHEFPWTYLRYVPREVNVVNASAIMEATYTKELFKLLRRPAELSANVQRYMPRKHYDTTTAFSAV